MTRELSEKGKGDLLLINRALETGDTKAYNELMRLYRDPLYFMLFEKVGNEEIAKDLTIEAL
ncbi:MAG: RNA polymerase subunit sigma-24, partial [Bacteroidota bacterium]|nr:RNA polymerase subunit sigma-24 [Bacteroidota bacterium]